MRGLPFLVLGLAGAGGAAAWALTRQKPATSAAATAAADAEPPKPNSPEERARQEAMEKQPPPTSSVWIEPQPGPHYSWADLTVTSTGMRNFPPLEYQKNLKRLVETILEPLYAATKKKAWIESAYRSPAVNRRVGGAPDSNHLRGLAADIKIAGMKPAAIVALAKHMRLPYEEAIIYEHKGHAHLSITAPDALPNSRMLLGKRDGSYAPLVV